MVLRVNTISGDASYFSVKHRYTYNQFSNYRYYETHGAIYNYKQGYDEFTYIGFTRENQQIVMKLENSNRPDIKFVHAINYGYDSSHIHNNYLPRTQFRHFAPEIAYNSDNMFMAGIFGGKAGIMLTSRSNMNLKWYAQLNKMTHINALTQIYCGENCYQSGAAPDFQSEVLVCGDYLGTNSFNVAYGQYEAAVAALDTSTGRANSYWRFTGWNPSGGINQDKCMGITYNELSEKISVLLQGKMGNLRRQGSSDAYD